MLLGRRQRGTDSAQRFSRVLAVAIPCFTVPIQIFQLTPGDYDIGTSLPLQLCDFAWVAAVWGLWTHRPLPVALTYYWGLTLTTQAILTPSLGQDVPAPAVPRVLVHALPDRVVGALPHPRPRDRADVAQYRVTVALTVLWAVVVYVFDVAVDVNYGYLVEQAGLGVAARRVRPVAGVRVRVPRHPAGRRGR